MRLCIAFGACALLIEPLAAVEVAERLEKSERSEKSEKSDKSSQYVRGVVITDGAAIYKEPDFDSPVVDYVGADTKVSVSKKAFSGAAGMGIFHQVRYGSKREGYIPDTDVRAAKAVADKAPEGAKASGSKMWEKEEQDMLGNAPLYFTRYLGGTVAMVNLKEKFSGRTLDDDVIVFGIRMMGPGTLFDGPPLDFNFLFTIDSPDYYSRFASGDANGYMLFSDVAFMLPLIDAKKTLVSYGIGLMTVYSSYRIPVQGKTFDSQELRVGALVAAGVGQKFGKNLWRGDAKYYFEKTQYPAYFLSFMGEY